MKMKGYCFLLMNLVISSAISIKQDQPVIVEIGEHKDIIKANNGSRKDDILTSNFQRSAIIGANTLWTSPVPYVLDNGLDINAKGVILKAFDQFRLKSCIDFKPRDSEDYYITVQKLNGCFSYVGRVESGGQILSIGANCDDIGIVEHEFLHALGFYHEQSRADRDDYVTIVTQNIQTGYENNFLKVGSDVSTTEGIPYNYLSVMHYGKDYFSNGNGSTIITKDPKYQDLIGQRLGVSPTDVLALNIRYKCNSTIAFQMYCGFSNRTMCQMSQCSNSGLHWEMVTQVSGGPSSDHTSLPGGNDTGEGVGYCMHVSTISGQKGDSAWLTTQRMSLNRKCNVQCLQFYYYNSGNPSDELNIWMREFQDKQDLTGTLHLMAQITGTQTSYWQLQYVSLNATKDFQIEFEVRKGAGSSAGGFSLDDINLSEIECPHLTMQIDAFEILSAKYSSGITKYSPRQYSSDGYSYRVGLWISPTYTGVFVQLLSGKYDDQLAWPCPQRQLTFQMVDQTPNIQLHMSKQLIFSTDPNQTGPDGTSYWDNPRKFGNSFVDGNETVFAGPPIGTTLFTTLQEMKSRDYLKGGSAVFAFSFQDLTPLINGSSLPCPQMGPVKIANPPVDMGSGSCTSGTLTTTPPPSQPTSSRTLSTSHASTRDDSIFSSSPVMVACPVLSLLLALILLIP